MLTIAIVIMGVIAVRFLVQVWLGGMISREMNDE